MAKKDKETVQEWLDMINDCQDRESRITEWEEGFLDSLEVQLMKTSSLSPKQAEILEKIWEKATSRG